MRGVIPNYHNCFVLFFVLAVLFSRPVFSIYANTLSPTDSLTVSSKRTIASLGDDFELGFFNPIATVQDDDRWYLGIWYKRIEERTYVWVANRDKPLSNSTGTLKISGNNLVLLDISDKPVWSTNVTRAMRTSVVAELLPNGNFVVRESKTEGEDGILWQSFDYPTDTLLPRMKLGLDLKTGHNRFLTSWNNSYDPSSGSYSYKLEMQGLPEFFIKKMNWKTYRSGPWDGIGFSGLPDMQTWNSINIVYNFTENKEEVIYTYGVTAPSIYTYSRLKMNLEGILQLYTWNPTSGIWDRFWVAWESDCDFYVKCTPYSYCDPNMAPVCNCIQGFKPRDQLDPPECDRKTQLSCSGDGFHRLRNMKLPDTKKATVDKRIGLKECEERCLRDCNCTAFANTNIQGGGTGCVMWTGELIDIRRFTDAGQDLYVRLAAVGREKPNDNNGKTRTIIGLSVGATVLLFLSFIILFFWRKHKQARALAALTNGRLVGQELYRSRLQNVRRTSTRHSFGEITEDSNLPLIEYDVLVTATNDFSICNKLGEGGFGAVYKGTLPGGEEIAVKKLSDVSKQGAAEFATEMQLIAKLQHINLVRLVGYYVDRDDTMLVYEYLENRSLDYHIFDKIKGFELNWEKRVDIVKGIARGLLYLHQDSPCRIIHRDLKASNILLDKDMIPKISDFGMARIFDRDANEASTRRVVGTYGYMAPEYAQSGVYSEKSDVFSFGVLLLEIVTGRKCSKYPLANEDDSLQYYVWRNMAQGTLPAVVDPKINIDPKIIDEVIRCLTIGLSCVQGIYRDRPTMSSVVLMLGSEKEPISKPTPPSPFWGGKYSRAGESSSMTITNTNTNTITITNTDTNTDFEVPVARDNQR